MLKIHFRRKLAYFKNFDIFHMYHVNFMYCALEYLLIIHEIKHVFLDITRYS